MERTQSPDCIHGRRAKRWRSLAQILLLTCVVAGCGSRNGLYSVSGQVTYQGKPLEHGSIVFISPKSRQVTADIELGEILNVTTIAANDGIAAGEYMVAITSRDRSEKYKDSMAPPSIIPIRYADVATSDLKATIQPNNDNALRFDLE
ncbi:MAG: hypothetical protein WD851_01710 [Pirellulales bacterium]